MSKATQYFDGVHSDPILVDLFFYENCFVFHSNGSEQTISFQEIAHVNTFQGNLHIELKSSSPNIPSPLFILIDPEQKTEFSVLWKQYSSFFSGISYHFTSISFIQKLFWATGVGGVTLYLFFLGFLHIHKITPHSYDIYLGEKAHKQIAQAVENCHNDTLDAFIEKLQTTLTSPNDHFQYKIQIINHSMVNAFALPGGRIYILKGLLEKSKSPDEILGILAHEIEHVENRHSVQQIARTLGTAFISSIVIGAAVEGVEVFESAEIFSEFLSTFFIMKYSRNFEKKADQKAVVRLHQNNLSASGMSDFFKRLQNATDSIFSTKANSTDSTHIVQQTLEKTEDWFSTHPSHTERVSYFEKAIAKETFKPNPAFQQEREHWNTIKKSCPESKEIDWWKLVL